jgi:hypothetical protein
MTRKPNNVTPLNTHLRRLTELARQRGRILALPPENALAEILDHPQPDALVRSFAEEDFFFLVHDIGHADSLEILSLASTRQWEYLLDIESWTKDRLNLDALTRWMSVLLKADPARFVRWAMDEKAEQIEYYLFKTSRVVIREHDQDPSDFGDGYITFDDVFYVKLPEDHRESEDDGEPSPDDDDKNDLLAELLGRMAEIDHPFYQQTLLRAAQVIPAESEEEFFLLRNVRLAEKGFVPFDEAVGIYQPTPMKTLKKRTKTIRGGVNQDLFIPVPLNHLAMMDPDQLFTRALSLIRMDDVFDEIQIEFAGLCNHLIAADPNPVRERDALKAVVKKACGYLGIGLQRLSGKKTPPDENRMAAMIRTYPLIDIFRAGYGLAADLKHRAENWREKSWFALNHLTLHFWGERLMGVIGGLLVKRPLYFDNYKTGVLYREFETMADIRRTRTALRRAMAFDDLFSCLSIDLTQPPKQVLITYKNLLLTLWARHRLSLPAVSDPIPTAQFRPFFADLWETVVPGAPPAVRESHKTEFLGWLAKESGFTEPEISRNLGKALERLFDEIADEYGRLSPEDLEPRFVNLFLLTQ